MLASHSDLILSIPNTIQLFVQRKKSFRPTLSKIESIKITRKPQPHYKENKNISGTNHLFPAHSYRSKREEPKTKNAKDESDSDSDSSSSESDSSSSESDSSRSSEEDEKAGEQQPGDGGEQQPDTPAADGQPGPETRRLKHW